MNKAYLLIGGNIGNRKENLEKATHLIEAECGNILSSSAVYETEAWGKTDQQSFYNQAILVATNFKAHELLTKVLLVEELMGRKRVEKYGPRIIDIDILFFNDEIINEPNLIIPHPEIHKRLFALIPLHEIAPEFLHPILKKPIEILIKECNDTLAVKKLSF